MNHFDYTLRLAELEAITTKKGYKEAAAKLYIDCREIYSNWTFNAKYVKTTDGMKEMLSLINYLGSKMQLPMMLSNYASFFLSLGIEPMVSTPITPLTKSQEIALARLVAVRNVHPYIAEAIAKVVKTIKDNNG